MADAEDGGTARRSFAPELNSRTLYTASLTFVELSGFKCFRDRTICGPIPPGSITAVVGPNGCGKSVIGEAVAFALGGNSRMLRAQSWASLCSQYRGAGAPPTKVAITLSVQHQQQALELRVERTIHGTSTRTRVSNVPQGSAPRWKDATQAELHHQLLPLGLNTKAIDRYVVTQSRQAIDVQDPLKLLQHLECLLGTAYLADDVHQQEGVAREIKESIQQSEDEFHRLQEVRRALAPELAKWRSCMQQQAELTLSRRKLLQRKHQLLQAKCHLNHVATAKLQRKQQDLQGSRQASAQALEELEVEKQGLVKQRQTLESKLKAARKQVDTAQAAAAQALLQLREAQEAAETSTRLKALAAKRLRTLQAKRATAAEAHSTAQAALKALEGRVEGLWKQEADMEAAQAKEVGGGRVPNRKSAPGPGDSKEEQRASALLLLAAKEAALKDAQRQHSRLVRELQVASGQLTSSQQAHDRQLAALQEAENSGTAHGKAAAEIAAKLASLESQLQQARSKLQGRRQQQVQAMVLLQQAEEALQALRSEIYGAQPAGRQPAQSGAQAGSAHGRGQWRLFDDTLLQLCNGSNHDKVQKQPAKLFGRLCNVLRVMEASAVAAVNAVLTEVCNPGTTLVTADRATAYAVVAAFKAVSNVTCKVLEELPAVNQPAQQQQVMQVLLPGNVNGVPLTAILAGDSVRAFGVAHLDSLIHHLFSGWALVETRDAALQAIAAQQQQQGTGRRRWSLVTSTGHVFKADGEIVVALGGGGRSYQGSAGLGASIEHGLGPLVKPLPGEDGPAASRSDSQVQDAAAAATAAAASTLLDKRRQVATKEVDNLRQRCVAAEAAAAAIEAEVRRIAGQVSSLQAQASAQAKAAGAAKHKAAAIRADMLRAGHQLYDAAGGDGVGPGANSDGVAPVSFLQAVRDKVQQLTRQEQEAKQEVAAYNAAVAAARQALPAIGVQGSGTDVAAEEPVDLPGVRRLLKQLSRQLGKAKSYLDACQREVQRLEQQACGLEQQAQQEAQTQGPSVAMLKKAHAKLLVQAEVCEETVEGLEAQADKVSEQCRTLEASMDQARERLEALEGQVAGAQAREEQAVGEGMRLREQLKVVTDELTSVEIEVRKQQEDAEQQEGNVEPARAEKGMTEPGTGVKAQHQPKRAARQSRHRAVVIVDKSSSSSDEEEEHVHAAKQPRRAAGRIRQGASVGSLAEDEAWVAAAEASVATQQSDLERLKMEINAAALQDDLDAIKALDQVRTRLAEQEQRLAAVAAAIEQLVDERYESLCQALATVNGELSRVYQCLTGWLGDAYLQFTADRRLLFISGITFNVRPDQHRWRPFASLSGGQQALSTLALAFALQAAFPSPFFFLDEVDAALDTLNAERVAEYMLLRSQGQSPVQPGIERSTQQAPSGAATGTTIGKVQPKDGVMAAGGGRNHTQYIVVSHRPQVFEKAACLVGVHSYNSASRAVTACMQHFADVIDLKN